MTKRKKIGIGVGIFAGICLAAGIVFSRIAPWRYWLYQYPEESYFGKETYREIIYRPSLSDKRQVQSVMDTAEQAFSFIGSKEEAEEQFGALARYSHEKEDYPETVSETHNLKLITAHCEDTTGYLWVEYSQVGIKADGEKDHGSWGILARWEIQKDAAGTWQVIDTDEAP